MRIRFKPVRPLGEGYDSEDEDVEDDPLVEEGVILRIEPGVEGPLTSELIRNCIETGDFSSLNIKWIDQRRAVLKIKQVMMDSAVANGDGSFGVNTGNESWSNYACVLLDLPTIIECNKSVDKGKNLLKTFDIAQVLLCYSKLESEKDIFSIQYEEKEDVEDPVLKNFERYVNDIYGLRRAQNDKQRRMSEVGTAVQDRNGDSNDSKHADADLTQFYAYKHGITPPLYNAKNRRMRKFLDPAEIEYIEEYVKMLVEQDRNAEEFETQLVLEHEVETSSNKKLERDDVSEKTTTQPQRVSFSSNDTVHVYNGSKGAANEEEQEEPQDENDAFDLELEQALQSDEEMEEEATAKDGLVNKAEDKLNSSDNADENLFGEDSDEDAGSTISKAVGRKPSEGGANKEESVFSQSHAQDDMADEEDEDDDDDEEDDDEDDDEDDNSDDENYSSMRTEVNEKMNHLKLVREEISEIENVLKINKKNYDAASNPLLKTRYGDMVKKLEKELEMKRKQLKADEDEMHGPEGASGSANDQSRNTNGDAGREDEDDDDEEEEEEEDEEDEDDEEDEEDGEEAPEEAPEDDQEELPEETQAQDNQSGQKDAGENEELDQDDMNMMLLFGADE